MLFFVFFHYLYAYAQCETSIKYHGSLCSDLGLLFVLSNTGYYW